MIPAEDTPSSPQTRSESNPSRAQTTMRRDIWTRGDEVRWEELRRWASAEDDRSDRRSGEERNEQQSILPASDGGEHFSDTGEDYKWCHPRGLRLYDDASSSALSS